MRYLSNTVGYDGSTAIRAPSCDPGSVRAAPAYWAGESARGGSLRSDTMTQDYRAEQARLAGEEAV